MLVVDSAKAAELTFALYLSMPRIPLLDFWTGYIYSLIHKMLACIVYRTLKLSIAPVALVHCFRMSKGFLPIDLQRLSLALSYL
jgi:hypothetical protein